MNMVRRILSHLVEPMSPILEVPGPEGILHFYCPTSHCDWRARTLYTKEPETIEWINGMAKGDVFWDVGANIGCYSLYAAKRGLKVIAIEPGAANFSVLMRNIELNGLDIQAFNVALSDVTKLAHLRMKFTGAGRALHGLNVDGPGFAQPTLAYSMDEFIQRFRLTPPDHLKIDVDGTERDIIKGAPRTLGVTRSLMMETEGDYETPEGFRWIRSVPADIIDSAQEWNVFFERIPDDGLTHSYQWMELYGK